MASLHGKLDSNSFDDAFLLKQLDFLAQSMEVEVVSDVFFVYFHKELMSLKVAEPANPAIARLAIVIVI